MQEFKYQFKILIRNRIMLFWAFAFPLILATFFHLAFSNLISNEGFTIVKIAIVEEQENIQFTSLIEGLSEEGENQLLEVTYVNEKEAKELLKEEEISAYLMVQEEIEVYVGDSGINETIIQTIVNNFYQVSSTMENIMELNPSVFMAGVLEDLELDYNNFNEISNENMDLTVIYFYTLIGMTCMYGGMWGLLVTTNMEANLSRQGTRIAMAPTSKYKVLVSGMLAAFICQYLAILLLFGYLTLGLNISFGNQNVYIVLLMAVGSFVGITMGNVIGNGLKAKEDTKITIQSIISMICSFFAGMMAVDIKYLVLEYFPIGAYINPVSLITDALYALYYYTTKERYFFNLVCLLVIGCVLTAISLLFMRKKQYDSI